MKPGLHPLACSNCGAPLDPTEQPKGAVVSCEHCDQPHMWVAPGKVEVQGSPRPAGSATAPKRSLLLPILLIVGVVLVVGIGLVGAGAAGFLFYRGGSAARVHATQGMPFALGDSLNLQIDNHGCDFVVLGFAKDGRLIGKPCAGGDPMPALWTTLEMRDFAFSPPRGGDVVIYRQGAGFARGIILAPEPGKKLRVRAFDKGAESVVSQLDAWHVQRSDQHSSAQSAVDDAVPLEKGDLLLLRDGAVLRNVRIESLDGATVTVTAGYRQGAGKFRVTSKEPRSESRSQLEATVVTSAMKLSAGNVVVKRAGASWTRLVVVAELKHVTLKVKDSAGVESQIPKQDLLLLR